MGVLKPSLNQFLLEFQLQGVKEKGENWRTLSMRASRKRKFIRDQDISDDALEEIWREFRLKRKRPFSSLNYLKKNKEGEYLIDVPQNDLTDVYLDILDGVILSYKQIKRRNS